MKIPLTIVFFALITAALVATGHSQSRYVKTVEAEFDDVFFDLKEAVIGSGLVIEHIGHVGKMLERTASAVTGNGDKDMQTYKFAKYLQFCSATITHKATGLDPANLSICPFLLYAFETTKDPGKVSVGYRNPDFGNLSPNDPINIEVHQLLKKFVDTAIADY